MKHLWEYEHPYYGADGYVNEFGTFLDMRQAIDNSDEDMNFVYRWDWYPADGPREHDELCVFHDELCVFVVMPRKERCVSYTCPINRDQEAEVIAWLRGPRMAGHLIKTWAPIIA